MPSCGKKLFLVIPVCHFSSHKKLSASPVEEDDIVSSLSADRMDVLIESWITHKLAPK